MYKVFINPGHCQKLDPGAINKELHINEAEIVFDIGEMLYQQLQSRGYTVYLEQSNNLAGEDNQPYAESVCYHANKEQCNLFISLHCNAFTTKEAHGTEVFWHPGSQQGKEIGQEIQKNITDRLGTENRYPNMEKGKKLIVINSTKMPAVLVELAFISNDDDAKKLITRKYDFANAIADAVDTFFKKDK